MCLLRTKYLEHIISSNTVILLSIFGNPFACPSTMFRNIIFECPCFIRRMRSWSLCLLLSTYSLCGFLFPVGYFLLCNPSTAQDVHYCLLPKQLNVFKILAVCPLVLVIFLQCFPNLHIHEIIFPARVSFQSFHYISMSS